MLFWRRQIGITIAQVCGGMFLTYGSSLGTVIGTSYRAYFFNYFIMPFSCFLSLLRNFLFPFVVRTCTDMVKNVFRNIKPGLTEIQYTV